MTSVLVYVESWGYGGVESYLMGLFRELASRGFSFTLFCTWDSCDERDAELAELGVDRRVLFKGHRPSQVRRLTEGPRVFRALLAERRWDAVHVNALNGGSYLYAREAARCGVPVIVVHSHNSDVGGSESVKRAAHRVMRSLWSGSETVRLACSDRAGRHLFGDEAFEVVHNGIDTKRFTFNEAARSATRELLGVPKDALLIGNPSRLHPQKNPLFQLEVFAEVLKLEPAARYLMRSDGELAEAVYAHADELDVTNEVIWFPALPDVASFYSAMDVMLFPSLYEGLSLVSVEAQAAGLPVLASTSISVESALTDLIRFEGLNRPALAWAEELLTMAAEPIDRGVYSDKVRAAGYDTADSAVALGEILRGEEAK